MSIDVNTAILQSPTEEDPATKAISKQIMLQLAARAVRRVHLDTQLFSLGQFDDAQNPDLIKRINTGMGVETAPEGAVRDALAQEYNTSKLGHGWKLRATGEDTYYGVIDREVRYRVRNDPRAALVDLQFHRVPDPNSKDQRGMQFPIGPLELKRAQWFKPDLITGSPGPGTSNLDAVVGDIRKLARFIRAARTGLLDEPDINAITPDDSNNKLHPHVLVWGVRDIPDDGELESDPQRFIKAAFDAARDCGCRLRTFDSEWLPARWALTASGPQTTRWLWIALAGLDATDDECNESTCRCHVQQSTT